MKKRNGFIGILRCWRLSKEPEDAHEDDNDNKGEDNYITYEDTTKDRAHFSENSYGVFKHYYQSRCCNEYETKLRCAEYRISDMEDNIDRLEKELLKRRQVLEEARRNLKELQEGEVIFYQEADNKIEAEWRVIRNIRSIVDVRYNDIFKHLEFDVEVRVPYDGEIYDFGDYTLCLVQDADEIICFRTRSGVRDDWKRGEDPDYYCYAGNYFRFEERRRNFISWSMQHNKLLEVIMDAIDCLHSVEDEDLEKIPKCFRKVVSKKGENEVR